MWRCIAQRRRAPSALSLFGTSSSEPTGGRVMAQAGEREGLERSTLKQYRNHVDTAPAAGQAMTTADVILEAVCLNCDRGLTLKEIAELPDFDDDEFDEVVENIDELVTIGAIVQRDDGDPDDDFELRYYPSPEGVAAWLNPSDEN